MESSKRSVDRYYHEFPEHDRLASVAGQLEFERSKRIVLRYLPERPGVVVDVGAGTGPYCFWLSSLGYETHLIEPAAGLVEQAKRQAQAGSVATGPKTYTVGDARKLWCDDGFADAVLMFGPLYHLLETSDRHTALAEALRVLNPGGVLFVAGISRAASFADGMISGCLADPAFCEIVEQDLQCGQHRNPTENLDYFTPNFCAKTGGDQNYENWSPSGILPGIGGS